MGRVPRQAFPTEVQRIALKREEVRGLRQATEAMVRLPRVWPQVDSWGQ